MSIHVHKIGLYSSASSVADSYAVGGNSPDVVADFVNEYYRVGGTVSDFPTMFSGYTTRSDLATQVDSDGSIKWCPHNTILHSEDFDNAWWTKTNTSITANSTTAPDGNSTADTVTDTSDGSPVVHEVYRAVGFPSSPKVGEVVTWAVYAKYSNIQYIVLTPNRDNFYANFDIQNGTVGNTGSNATASITDCGSGWYLCKVTWTIDSTINPRLEVFLATSNGTTRTPTYTGAGTGVVYLWGAHAYRSDLGGMVDVPTDMRAASGANFATYVPTTTAAKYLQRRGNHVYNGSSWVNKGIQIETEARTNLAIHSNTLSSWSRTSGETTTQNATGPDGVANSAWTWTCDLAAAAYARHPEITAMDGNTITISMWFKDVNLTASDYIYLRNVSSTNGGAVWIDKDGTIVNTTGTSALSTVTNYGNGWFRVSHTCAVGTVANNFVDIGLDTSSYNFTPRAGSLSFLAYGMQCEVGSTPSSYIPTSGSTVTRAADSLQIPAANMAYSTTAMSFQIDGTITYADDGFERGMFDAYQSAANYFVLMIQTSSTKTGDIEWLVESGDTVDSVAGAATQYTPGVNVPFNLATRYTSSAINYAKDGVADTANTTIPSIYDYATNSINLRLGTGQSGFGTYNKTMSNISQFRQWDVDLGDSGIATAST